MSDGEKYRIIVRNHEITPRRAPEACESGRGDAMWQRGHKFDARGKGQCHFVHRVEFAYGLSPSSQVSKFEARDTHLNPHSNSARLLARPLAYAVYCTTRRIKRRSRVRTADTINNGGTHPLLKASYSVYSWRYTLSQVATQSHHCIMGLDQIASSCHNQSFPSEKR